MADLVAVMPEDIPRPPKARDPYASISPSAPTQLSSLPPLILRFEMTEVSIYFVSDYGRMKK